MYILDTGSQISAISNACVQRLGLKTFVSNRSISEISNISTHSKGAVQCSLRSNLNPNTVLKICAVVVPTISTDVHSIFIPEKVNDHFKGLCLADNQFHSPSKVDILLVQIDIQISCPMFNLTSSQENLQPFAPPLVG